MTTRRAPSIRRKILTRTILLSLVPLLLLGGAALGSLRGLQRSVDESINKTEVVLTHGVAASALRRDASNLGSQIEQYVGERIDDLVGWSDAPVVRAATGGDTSGAELFLRGAVDTPASPFLAIALVDLDGEVVLSVDGDVPAERDGGWVEPALDEGAFVGRVNTAGEIPYVGLAVRVQANDGTPLGVVWSALDSSFLRSVADDYRGDKNDAAHVSIFDRTSALLAETLSDNADDRLYDEELERTEFEQTSLEHGLSFDPTTDAERSGLHILVFEDEFVAHEYVTDISSLLRPDLALSTDWIVQVQEPLSVALAPLASIGQIPDSLDSSVRSMFLAIGVAVIVALLTSIFAGRALARRIVRPITRLRDEADEVAGERLPDAVATIAEGGTPPPAEPIVLDADDEVGELADSFNKVQRTAIDLAADQANLRRRFSDLFVYLGRRNQNLLGRQLELIDDLERDEDDSELLGSLFDLDHLATRMRRNAESLLVIAGRETTRTWTEPVAIRDVVRVASSEVEDYTRIQLGQFADVRLRGEAVSDIAHLLAELVENALRYSPPTSVVTVCGQPYEGDAYVISISDQGLGLDAADLTAINGDLKSASSADDPERIPTSSLGLFVVGRLAHRHGCKVRLTSGDEGTMAWVQLSPSLLAPPEPNAPTSEPPAVDPEPVEGAPAAEARPGEGAVRTPPATPSETEPTTMAEALTLQPTDPDDPAPIVESPVPPMADGDHTGVETPPERTASGFTRRVSRSRRDNPPAIPADAPRTFSPAPPRSAEDVGNRLRRFKAAVEQGRAAGILAATDGTDRQDEPQGEGP